MLSPSGWQPISKARRSIMADDTISSLDAPSTPVAQTPRMQLICFGESSLTEVNHSLSCAIPPSPPAYDGFPSRYEHIYKTETTYALHADQWRRAWHPRGGMDAKRAKGLHHSWASKARDGAASGPSASERCTSFSYHLHHVLFLAVDMEPIIIFTSSYAVSQVFFARSNAALSVQTSNLENQPFGRDLADDPVPVLCHIPDGRWIFWLFWIFWHLLDARLFLQDLKALACSFVAHNPAHPKDVKQASSCESHRHECFPRFAPVRTHGERSAPTLTCRCLDESFFCSERFWVYIQALS